jgi:CHASE1-domain containing sensor protein
VKPLLTTSFFKFTFGFVGILVLAFALLAVIGMVAQSQDATQRAARAELERGR